MTFSLMPLSIDTLHSETWPKDARHNNTKGNDSQGYGYNHIGNILTTQRLTVKMFS